MACIIASQVFLLSSLLHGHMVPLKLPSIKMTWEAFYFILAILFLSKNCKTQLVLRKAEVFFARFFFFFIFDNVGVLDGS